MSWDRKAERKEKFDKRTKAKDKQKRKEIGIEKKPDSLEEQVN